MFGNEVFFLPIYFSVSEPKRLSRDPDPALNGIPDPDLT